MKYKNEFRITIKNMFLSYFYDALQLRQTKIKFGKLQKNDYFCNPIINIKNK